MGLDGDVPEGERFLQLIWSQEDECQNQTDNHIADLGTKAPKCLNQLGTVLSLLDRMSSCRWPCRKGDHRLEYLCGRSMSNARAVLRLIRLGFYDEALVLSRGLGEVANLMQLFICDAEAFNEWKNASAKEIRRNFQPVKIRCRLENMSRSPVIDKDRYKFLSEQAVHVHPGTTPQAHNILGMPNSGAELQEAGIVVCLNEVSIPVCFIAIFGATLLHSDDEIAKYTLSSARTLVEHIGGLNIVTADDYYQEARAHLNAEQRVEIVKWMLHYGKNRS